jgi:tetratricopeptide (TPR) repeat protein
VAEAYAAGGFYEQALAATQVGGYGFDQARALGAVAVEMAKAGRVEEVRRAVGVIEGSGVAGFQKANALSDVAAVYLNAGKVEAAKEMLAKALTLNLAEEESDPRERTTAEIAVKFAEAGDFEKALEATREIRKVFEQTFALADIGLLQGKSGVGLSVQSRGLLNEIANSHSHN